MRRLGGRRDHRPSLPRAPRSCAGREHARSGVCRRGETDAIKRKLSSEAYMEATADIGLIGLAVMGQNLALNIADHGFKVAVYNRTTATMKDFVAQNPTTPGGLVGATTMAEL